MKIISAEAGLSRMYTKHQIRKTTSTGLLKQGHSLQEIAHVTRHKNIESLKHYISQPSYEDKARYAKSLYQYTKKTTDTDQEDVQVEADKPDDPQNTPNVSENTADHNVQV